jgi:hypothetical protein
VAKLKKIICEVCGDGENHPEILDYHHIIERHKVESNNNMLNLAILCASCHRRCHQNIKIIGVIPSTKMPYGRTLIYEIDGIRNILGVEPIPIPELPNIKIRNKE